MRIAVADIGFLPAWSLLTVTNLALTGLILAGLGIAALCDALDDPTATLVTAAIIALLVPLITAIEVQVARWLLRFWPGGLHLIGQAERPGLATRQYANQHRADSTDVGALFDDQSDDGQLITPDGVRP